MLLMFSFLSNPSLYGITFFFSDYRFRFSIKCQMGHQTCLNNKSPTYLTFILWIGICHYFTTPFLFVILQAWTPGGSSLQTTPSLRSILRKGQWRCNQQYYIWGCLKIGRTSVPHKVGPIFNSDNHDLPVDLRVCYFQFYTAWGSFSNSWISPRDINQFQTNQLSITTTLQINLDGVYGCIL